MNKKLLVSFSLGLISLTACGGPNVEDYTYSTFDSESGLYTIEYPNEWESTSATGDNLNLRDPYTSGTFGINIVTLYGDETLETVMEEYQQSMGGSNQLEELEQSEMTISGHEALYSHYVLTIEGKRSDTDLESAVWLISLNEETMLRISFNCISSFFEDLLPAAEYMISTLQIQE